MPYRNVAALVLSHAWVPVRVYILPLYGRYKPEVLLSPVENITYPAALLSRFDLLFLLLDKPSRDDDERLAQHVAHVRMYNRHPDLEPLQPALTRYYVTPVSIYQHSLTINRNRTMRLYSAYIAFARRCRPVVPSEVQRCVILHRRILRALPSA